MKKNVNSVKKIGVSVEELFSFVDKLREKSKTDKSLKAVFESASQKWDAHISACN